MLQAQKTEYMHAMLRQFGIAERLDEDIGAEFIDHRRTGTEVFLGSPDPEVGALVQSDPNETSPLNDSDPNRRSTYERFNMPDSI